MADITILDFVVIALVIGISQGGVGLVIPAIAKVDGYCDTQHLAIRIFVGFVIAVLVMAMTITIVGLIAITAYR